MSRSSNAIIDWALMIGSAVCLLICFALLIAMTANLFVDYSTAWLFLLGASLFGGLGVSGVFLLVRRIR